MTNEIVDPKLQTSKGENDVVLESIQRNKILSEHECLSHVKNVAKPIGKRTVHVGAETAPNIMHAESSRDRHTTQASDELKVNHHAKCIKSQKMGVQVRWRTHLHSFGP